MKPTCSATRPTTSCLRRPRHLDHCLRCHGLLSTYSEGILFLEKACPLQIVGNDVRRRSGRRSGPAPKGLHILERCSLVCRKPSKSVEVSRRRPLSLQLSQVMTHTARVETITQMNTTCGCEHHHHTTTPPPHNHTTTHHHNATITPPHHHHHTTTTPAPQRDLNAISTPPPQHHHHHHHTP